MVEIDQVVLNKKNLKYFNIILIFCYYLPLEKGMALNLKKTWIPFIQGCFEPNWMKLAQWFWRRRFLNIFNLILLFLYYLPLEKGAALHLNKLESPPPKNALCPVWLILAQWIWRRSRKLEKFKDRLRDRQTATDGRRSEKLTWAFSSGDLKRRCFSEISRIECFPSNRQISYFCRWNMCT